MPGNVEEIYELSISRLPTEQYDHTILSLLVRCLFISRGKHLAQHCLSLFLLFQVRVASHLATWSLSPEWRKTLWPPNTSFQLWTFSFIYKRWTFISANKQLSWRRIFTKVSKVGLLFDFNFQCWLVYATFKLLAQFSFASVLKME